MAGLKRHKLSKKLQQVDVLKQKKIRNIQDDVPPPPFGDLADDKSEVLFKEPSVYDNLLVTLRSCNKSFAHEYKKRQREEEEGKSESEDEFDDAKEYRSPSEGEDTSEEDTKSEGSHDRESRVQDLKMEDENAGTESEDDQEAFDVGQMVDMGIDSKSVVQKSTILSSFQMHMNFKLSEGDVQDLSRKQWEYKWVVPAFDKSNCMWAGTGECFLKDVCVISDHSLKQRLYLHWLDVYKKSGGDDFDSSKQRNFFFLCNSYRDILHCNKKPFYLGFEEDSSTMDGYIMHSLNHIFRTRDLVTKNDSKVAKHRDVAKDGLVTDNSYLDRGFTRPKVLILLPLRSIAFRVVKRLIQLTPQVYKVNVEHLDRFINEFGTQDDEENVDEKDPIEIARKSQKSSKPSDFQALFTGNDNDDEFMMGIKFTRRSIKLFNDVYSSDMIVASPLKLHKKIGEAQKNKENDVDYLSSIEVLIIDHSDVIATQNWAFLSSVLEQLNNIPSKQHGTDIMRIRKWYLDGHAKFYRQTIILGHYVNPDISASFNKQCVNYQGKVKSSCKYKGVLHKVLLQVRQIYERFDASMADVDDVRLDYFINKVFPKIKDPVQGGIMLFISSYFEFVRIRNFLKSQNASFCLLGDYTENSDVSRARILFLEGRRKIMLYTERFHFHRRYKIRGIKNLIIYSLPERKEFYPEIVNMLEGASDMTCTVLFSRFDKLRLERIVGVDPARRMVTSEKSVFVFR